VSVPTIASLRNQIAAFVRWPDFCVSHGFMRHTYQGPERRHNRVFVTLHSEYHCRDGVCVAVRNRETGAFLTDHVAIGRHVDGSIRFNEKGGIVSAHDATGPEVGENLFFSSDEVHDPRNVLTSALTAIRRPPKEIVASYPLAS
jgi:hypothetical protein